MKVIKITRDVIDIPFVDADGKELLKLEFEVNDENLTRIINFKENMGKEEVSTLEDMKATIKKYVDITLGDGSFEKIYAINPNIIAITIYFKAIAEGILSEINERKFNMQNNEIDNLIN
ncbi:hypothetical protein ACQV2S_01140 [Facklamia sp. P13064]|uniref:hypothetical protein n=1 Tax=Facklamia sp. P13064 TaxID=3421953 RepID=UPI003D186A9E